MSVSAGDRLGPYTIVAPLGEGGMGAVYRARDPRLGRDVAIKVLRPDRVSDPQHKQRFEQEAKAASALNHPNIVTVYDIGTEGDVVYLVMELVDGHPLDREIPTRGFRVPEVLRIGAQIADACARAHAAGIVHRDLKPANVMLSSDGRAKVLDFGLAKLVEAEAPDAAATRAAQTVEGMIVGTAAYMSPEQAEGRPLDVRSDIFSLGAMLYELSTGQQAFQGDTTMSVIASVLRQEPRPMGEIRADVPPELSRLIMRCLRKDPARRVQSMADLMVALQELREEYDSGTLEMTAAAAPAGRATSGGLWKGAAAAAVVVAAFAAWRMVANRPIVDEALLAVPLTTYPGNENSPSFSPDGNQVAFVWNGEDRANPDIYVKLIGPGPPLRLTTDPRPDFGANWSPDGRNIAFFRTLEGGEVALLMVSPLGGPERKLAQFYTRQMFLLPIASLTWTPDSKGLVVSASQTPTDPNRLLHLSVESGEVTPIGPTPASVAEGYTSVALSPDGHSLAAVLVHGTRMLQVFSVSNTFELSAARALPSAGDVGQVRWTRDSRDLVFSVAVNNPSTLYRMSIAGGKPYVLPWAGAGALNPAIAPQGDRMVFTRDARDTNIWRVLLDPRPGEARTLDQIAVSSFRDVAPRYSPDGKRLAFHSNRSGSVQVWASDADGSHAVQLTSMDPLATTGTPRWSPDGQRVAFDSNATGTFQVYVISADGGQPHALTSGVSNNFVSAWSHDARWIYFSSNRGGANQVWKAPSGGGDAVPVTTRGGQAPDVSPDGKWLYFTKDDGARGVWRMPIDGGEEARIVEAVHRNNFAVAANGVYFVPPAGPDRSSSVQYVDFATGARRQIARIDKPVDLGLTVSPDGRYLLFTQMDYLGQDLMLVERFR